MALALLLITAVVFVLAGLYVVRGRALSAEDFVSARGSAGAAATAASLFASGLGAWILFSPAEAAARTGVVALGGYAVGSALAIAVFAWLGPRIRGLVPEGHAVTELVLHRYGRAMYGFVLLITVFYMFVYLAAELTGIGFAVQTVTGLPAAGTVIAVLVGTAAYTAYGGLRASLRTDGLQAVVLVPLLVAVPAALVAHFGGLGAVFGGLTRRTPELLDAGAWPGWESGISLVIAIVGANLFNQGSWQRIWACRDERTLRRAFGWAALLTVPAIVLAGTFGLLAQSGGVLSNPSAALFDVLDASLVPWVGYAILVLGVTLVMSSADTLLNALVSLFTVDAARLRPGLAGGRLLRLSRWATLVPAALAGLVALQGYSVLYLFLLADLVCTAAAAPVFYGLFQPRLNGAAAAVATAAGLVAGIWLFPDPSFSSGSMFWAFVAAALIPAALSWALSRRGLAFDLSALRRHVREFEA